MKTPFKIAPTPPARPAPGPARRGWLVAALLSAGLLLGPGVARAQTVYWTQRDLLGDFFPRSERVSFKQFDLATDVALRADIERRLGYPLPRTRYTVYVATTAGQVDGYALFDDEPGQHLPISFAVKVSAAGLVERQEVVAYREARGDEVKDARFRAQFVGKSARDALRAGDDLVAISGATISSRAMALGVKRALVLIEGLLLQPARSASASARRG